ncbi:LysR family substrate-binding domain-containing protein [Siccirubricoccus deserti]
MALACVTSALFDFLPPLVRALRAAQPDAAIAVQEMDTADAVEALRRGEVDFALARLDRDRPPFKVLPLGEDALVVALPEGHPLLAAAALPLASLAQEPLVLLPRSISPAYFDRQVSACRAAGSSRWRCARSARRWRSSPSSRPGWAWRWSAPVWPGCGRRGRLPCAGRAGGLGRRRPGVERRARDGWGTRRGRPGPAGLRGRGLISRSGAGPARSCWPGRAAAAHGAAAPPAATAAMGRPDRLPGRSPWHSLRTGQVLSRAYGAAGAKLFQPPRE